MQFACAPEWHPRRAEQRWLAGHTLPLLQPLGAVRILLRQPLQHKVLVRLRAHQGYNDEAAEASKDCEGDECAAPAPGLRQGTAQQRTHHLCRPSIRQQGMQAGGHHNKWGSQSGQALTAQQEAFVQQQ
jgi:hypothetical protein